MQLTKEEILPTLIKALEIETHRCDNFAIISKAYDDHYTEFDRIENAYRINRCKRLWYVIRWLDGNNFPNEVELEHKLSHEEYKKQFVFSFNITERTMDLLGIFENKMLEEWEKKLKETQTITLEQKRVVNE